MVIQINFISARKTPEEQITYIPSSHQNGNVQDV